ncbi:MAG TPA: hypothetical protein VGK20_12310 [Candidatus Binatia bacterium]|jgi:hypothetical protein
MSSFLQSRPFGFGHKNVDDSGEEFSRHAWVRSDAMLLGLVAVALISSITAVSQWVETRAQPRPSRQSPATTDMDVGTPALEVGPFNPAARRSAAEEARAAAQAERFRAAKNDVMTYVPQAHEAAQQNEIAADLAFTKADYESASRLYALARAGYADASDRAVTAQAAAEKTTVDSQVAADARSARSGGNSRQQAALPAGSSSQMASDASVQDPGSRVSGRSPMNDAAVAGAAAAPAVAAPSIIDVPHDSEVAGALRAEAEVAWPGGQVAMLHAEQVPQAAEAPRGASRSGNSWAIVYAQTAGGRAGGGWGACWRHDADSARACAKSSCQDNSASDQPCVEIAAGKPGEDCFVAHARGFGVSAAACRAQSGEAEQVALQQCREVLASRFGAESGCRISWSSVR